MENALPPGELLGEVTFPVLMEPFLYSGGTTMMRKFHVRINGEEYLVEVSELAGTQDVEGLKIEKMNPVVGDKYQIISPLQVTTILRAPMPGRVLSVLLKKGDRVSAGQVGIILEAMKMENEIQIESNGVITQVFVEENDTVDTGDPLLEFEENQKTSS